MNAPVRIGTHRVIQIGGTRNGRQPAKRSTFVQRFNTHTDLTTTLRREDQSRAIGSVVIAVLPWLVGISFMLLGVAVAAWVVR